MGHANRSKSDTQDASSDGRQLHVDTLALAALALAVLLIGLDGYRAISEPSGPVSLLFASPALDTVLFATRALVLFLFLAVVPGTLWLTLFGFGPRAELRWLLYSVGTSLLTIMAVGLLLTLGGPAVGVDRPLSPLPVGVTHGLVVAGLSVLIGITDPPSRRLTVPDSSQRSAWLARWLRPTTFGLLLVAPLTVLSVDWLNRTGDNRPLIAVLVVIALVPMAVAVGVVGRRWLSTAVGVVGISLLYHDSLWQHSHFSGQGNIVAAWQTGRWAITERSAAAAATSPLLPNVTVSPTFAHLSNVDIFVQLSVFNPLLVALIPLGSFALFRRFVDPPEAALGGLLVAFIHPFYYQLPAGGRAAMPVLFLVLSCVALTDSELQPVVRQGLALGFVAVVVTAHYGASYFVMVGLVVALAVFVGLYTADGVLGEPTESTTGTRRSRIRDALRQRSYSFSMAFVAFYIALSFGWYQYTFEGQKLSAFFSRIRIALVSFLESGAGGGGSASRLTRAYGAASIELSRTLYILLAVLSLIGVLYLLGQRLLGDEWQSREGFDEFLALGVGMLAVFSLTFVLQSLWGGGRPMAIAFSVSALFAVIGIAAIADLTAAIGRRLPGVGQLGLPNVRVAWVLCAALLALLLVLNSGVAAATVLGGTAPSSVPLQPAIEQRAGEDPGAHQTVHFHQDVSMLVWLNSNADGETDAFADGITQQNNNDIYDPQITAGVDPGSRASFRVKPNLFAAVDHDDAAYVLFPSYSVNLGVAEAPDSKQYTGARGYRELDAVERRLADENKIYTNGDSEIYRLVDRTES